MPFWAGSGSGLPNPGELDTSSSAIFASRSGPFARPGDPANLAAVGPTYAPEEPAGRKVVALFGRAAARDFVDAFGPSEIFDRKLRTEN